jgi:glycosyltransferase involved in cell wall biosynthesis
MQPFRVAYVIYQAPNKQADGGVQSISLAIDAVASSEIVNPVIITNRDSPKTELWKSKGWPVHVMSFVSSGRAHDNSMPSQYCNSFSAHGVRLDPELMTIFRDSQIQVVHCNDELSLWFAAWSARSCGARVVVHVRDTLSLDTYWWSVSRAISDCLVALSVEMKAIIENEIPGKAPVKTIYSISDKFEWSFDRPRQARVGMFGQIQPKKCQLELLNFIHDHPSWLDDLELVIVGDAPVDEVPYQKACLSVKSRLPNVTFAGYTSRPEDWYRQLDVVLVSSEHEGLARSMIEALSLGVPVVSTRVCSAQEILEDHGCGVVVEKGDYSSLLTQALLISKDRELHRRLSLQATKTAETLFSSRFIVNSYRALYQELS